MKWTKQFTWVLFMFIGILLGIVFYFIMPTSDPDESVKDPGNQLQRKMIRLHHPKPGQTIESPLRVEGEARGMWYFEASFPIKLLSKDERVIAEHYVQADGKWMTEEFVPFVSQISFSQPESDTGWLVLERSNPSGRSEHADELRVPVEFPGEESMEISVYFNKKEVAECENTVPVSRTISRPQAPARAALENLFPGPTWQEQQKGYLTSIPDGVIIERLVIEDRTAELKLNEKIDEGVAGSCWVQAIRSQIEKTLRQFQSVDSVVISVDGRTDEVLQP